MQKLAGMLLLLVGVAGIAMAIDLPSAPEIDASSGTSALALLSGALLMVRSRRSRS